MYVQIPDVPLPKPRFEIFVYSPRVEGVHLRGGAVARGGLRWSERHEDFRTEVLGLVKAQQVKNAVIVPVGATVVRLQLRSVRRGRMRSPSACFAALSSGPQIDSSQAGKTPRVSASRSDAFLDSSLTNCMTAPASMGPRQTIATLGSTI